MAASSFTRCGRLSVLCNWTMTASTISSFIPSRSTFFAGAAGASTISTEARSAGGGDGGGVWSNLMAWLGFLERDADGDKPSESSLWARFAFLFG